MSGKEEWANLSEEEKKALRKKRKEEKKRLKKEKKMAKAARAKAKVQQTGMMSASWEEYLEGKKIYGELPTMMSKFDQKIDFVPIKSLNKSLAGKTVTVRARIHTKRSASKDMMFLLLRDGMFTAQGVVQTSEDKKTLPREMVRFTKSIPIESIVDIIGVVKAVEKEITSCSQKDIEISVEKLFVVSSSEVCPLIVEDAMKSDAFLEQKKLDDEKKGGEEKKGDLVRDVTMSIRLDNRVLDLRAPAHIAIFKIQSAVGMLFREFLYKNRFMEIHSPKMCATASEGGTEVFTVNYFKKKAYLTQSPQLYKQMAIMCDWERVFEIGEVFRAEKHFTNRHLTEFTGLDIEMKIMNHYHEVLDILDGIFVAIFSGLEERFADLLEVVRTQYPFEPLMYNKKGKNLRLTFAEGIKMLREAGVEIGDYEDLGTPEEKLLGKLVKEKYKTDFYILDKYPMDARPFYTMPCPHNPKYSNSYDLFVRGEEIVSGAQRIHDPKMLLEKAKEKKVDLTPIMDYVSSFKYGAFPHGGAGIGLERTVMLFLGLPNIRKCTMFPRDPKRVTP